MVEPCSSAAWKGLRGEARNVGFGWLSASWVMIAAFWVSPGTGLAPDKVSRWPLTSALSPSAQVHAYIISSLKKEMPNVFGKESKKKELVNNLGEIYAKIEREHQISAGDFPSLRKMQVQPSGALRWLAAVRSGFPWGGASQNGSCWVNHQHSTQIRDVDPCPDAERGMW